MAPQPAVFAELCCTAVYMLCSTAQLEKVDGLCHTHTFYCVIPHTHQALTAEQN